jgi:hypothetical protein
MHHLWSIFRFKKKELKGHNDKNHRITNSKKMMMTTTNTTTGMRRSEKYPELEDNTFYSAEIRSFACYC